MNADHHELLDPGYLDGLERRPVGQLRAMRAECIDVETGVSYLRRLVHGALDIVRGELARRAEGGDTVDVTGLVDRLPELLGEHDRPGGVGRLPRTLEPVQVDPALQAEYDRLAGGGRLARSAELSGVELAELLDGLRDLELRLAERRRALFERIDALQAEIARRYQTGELRVDDLLRSEGP